MKTKLITSVVGLAIFFCMLIAQVQADMLSGGVTDTGTIAKFRDGSSEKSVYVSPMEVQNATTGESFLAFCGDFRVNTSSGFGSSGEPYGNYSLDSADLTIYSDFQKTAIDSLFGNTYSSAFDMDGDMTNVALAKALQLCIWEILTETSGGLDLLSGDFLMLSGISDEIAGYANDFISALNGDITWDSIGYDYTHYEIDVWVAEGGTSASQTLINVKPNATPEPATALIVGVGTLFGASILRRRHRNR